MSSEHDAGGPVPFEAPRRTKPGLKAAVVGFDPVVGVLGPSISAIVGWGTPAAAASARWDHPALRRRSRTSLLATDLPSIPI
jgi:hypothetical protein